MDCSTDEGALLPVVSIYLCLGVLKCGISEIKHFSFILSLFHSRRFHICGAQNSSVGFSTLLL